MDTFFQFICIVKPVYKGHSREPENVVFMSSCPLYTGLNYNWLLWTMICYIEVTFKACLIVYTMKPL
jgi:hypothetical protein